MSFWNSLAFTIIQWMLEIWSLVPLSFLNWAWTSGSSQFMYCWRLAWRILSITLLACEMSANCVVVWKFFVIAFLWDWNKKRPFWVLWPRSLGICNFLEEISSLSHSNVFFYFFALTTEEGFLISPCYSLGLSIQMGISFLFSFAFYFPSFHSCL